MPKVTTPATPLMMTAQGGRQSGELSGEQA
jgi:hypothetical protein